MQKKFQNSIFSQFQFRQDKKKMIQQMIGSGRRRANILIDVILIMNTWLFLSSSNSLYN